MSRITSTAALLVTLIAVALCVTAQAASPWTSERRPRIDRYRRVIDRVVSMPSDGELQRRARRHGFNVVNVMWEDTGRAGGSAIGPNISDLTLQVREEVRGGMRTHLLPVIRYPNFTDKTGDIKAEKIWVRIGNHDPQAKRTAVPLTEVLGNLRDYLSDPDSLQGNDNFLARRDTHLLVSAQHVFVPIPKGGKAEFNPVLFNYQSSPGSPAVLTLLITREGTSAAVIENRPGDQSWQGWGQQLYFNNAGQRTVFTAERKSDVKARIDAGQATKGDEGALDEGADMMMVVQVPLRHHNRGPMLGLMADEGAPAASGAPMMEKARRRAGPSDVEQAVIGHGEDLGPYAEMNGLRLRRDERFPIRVTVQFYRATSNGIVSDQDLADVKEMIDRVYDDADYVGSLVIPEGPRHRPTDWIKDNPNHGWMPWGSPSLSNTYVP